MIWILLNISSRFQQSAHVRETWLCRLPLKKGNDSIVKCLLSKPGAIQKNLIFESLVNAVENGHDAVVALLLQKSTLNIQDSNFLLLSAIYSGNFMSVDLLLEHGKAEPEKVGGIGAIKEAAIKGHHKIVESLLKDGRADPNEYVEAAMFRAILSGYHKIVKLVLEDGRYDPSKNNNWLINMASSKGQVKILKLLLNDPRVDPTARDNQVIRNVAKKKDVEMLRALVEDGRADLSVARQNGCSDIIDRLLEELKHENDPSLSIAHKVNGNVPAQIAENESQFLLKKILSVN